MAKEIYILSAVRTAMGSWGGALKDFSATQLGAEAIKSAIQKSGVANEAVQEVIMGCVMQANLGKHSMRRCRCYCSWWYGKHE
jgi:acetyl-CoA C-acetyltransferase